MKLSEAIRLGSMTSLQAFGMMKNYGNGNTCALGAAREAIGLDAWCAIEWPLQDVACPVCQEVRFVLSSAIRDYSCSGLFYAIAHVNDVHRWTRPQIADWVELQEQQLEGVDELVASAATVISR